MPLPDPRENQNMAISRAQLAAELEPGLNALFGMEYDQYNQEYAEIFSRDGKNNNSDVKNCLLYVKIQLLLKQ